jgi:hypothetical protein
LKSKIIKIFVVNKMSSPSNIRSFQVRFTNGYLVQEDYMNNIVLERIIDTHTLSDIRKISFYFDDGQTPFHSLILRNPSETDDNIKFDVDFFTYYNDNNKLTELTKDEKENDYNIVMSTLLTSNILKEKLISNINLPVFE